MIKETIQIALVNIGDDNSPSAIIALVDEHGNSSSAQFIGMVATNRMIIITEPANLLVFLNEIGLNKLAEIQKNFADETALLLSQETLEEIKHK